MGENMDKPICLEACDSTNKYLKANLTGFQNGAVVYTLNQTAGRGRLGRRWAGSAGGMLAFSMLLDLEDCGLSRRDIPLISLMSAIATAGVLEQMTDSHSEILEGCEIKIKWPNDVLLNRNAGGFKKVCGILCEGSLDFGNPVKDYIIAGIGINLTQPRCFFDEGGISHAGSVFENSKMELDIDKLVLSLRDNIFEEIALYKIEKNKYLSKRFTRFDSLEGKDIVILSLGGDVLKSGIACGVASDGALLVKPSASDIPEKVYAGDISVRRSDIQDKTNKFGYI